MEIEFNDYYNYDENSPSFLSWKVVTNRKFKIGDPVGCINGSGYYCTNLKGKAYLIHRIIWKMFNKVIDPKLDIDHFDGIKTNNCITNLRLGKREVNARNYPMRKDNISGVKGVCRVINRRNGSIVYKGWKAFWHEIDGKYNSKTFGEGVYGVEESFKLACEYRSSQMERLEKEGAGYTDRHKGE